MPNQMVQIEVAKLNALINVIASWKGVSWKESNPAMLILLNDFAPVVPCAKCAKEEAAMSGLTNVERITELQRQAVIERDAMEGDDATAG